MIINSDVIESKTKHNNRNLILNNAYELFLSKGIENISINEIAEKSGMKRRNFYYYYKEKDLIAFDIMKNWYFELEKIMKPENDHFDNALSEIKYMITRFIKLAKEDPNFIIYSTQFDNYFRNKNVSELFSNYDMNVLGAISEKNLIIKGIEDGSINSKYKENAEVVENIISDCLLALVQKILFYQNTFNKSYDTKLDDLDILVDFFIDGIKSK